MAQEPVAAPEQESVLAEYGSLLRRHRLTIFLCAIAGLILALLSTIASRPLYRARASINVQGINGDFMNIREVSRVGMESNETAQQTQIKLLQSDTLSARTVVSLLRDPHPATVQKMDMLSRTMRALHLPGSEAIPYATVVDDAARRVEIKPLGVTLLVELRCESWDPTVAQTFCNRLIREYKDEDVETRSDEAKSTSVWLTRQLADIKAKATESQQKLAAAVDGNGLMLSQDTSSTGEERLRELQTELVRAQADRMQKEAEANVARTATADTLPNVMDNPIYRQYQTQIADLKSKLSASPLTEANPKMIRLRAQLADAEQGLAASQSTSSGRQNNELSAARHREQLLKVAYDAQLATVSTDLQKASQVSLLRREVESEQQLYQTMLQRAKEAGFASAMQASTMRVVDAAALPIVPISPRPVLSGIAGLVLGGFGSAAFFLFTNRARRILRTPGQVPQLLEIQELGVIPRAVSPTDNGLFAKAKGWPARRFGSGPSTKPGHALAMTGWGERFSIVAEAYRSTSFSILLADMSQRSHTYVITSPADGEGKTTVVSNIGVALSRSRMRVLLIDGDMRKPRLHHSFGIREDFGLRNLLRGELDLEKVPLPFFVKETATPNLWMIPAGRGSEDTVQLLHSENMQRLLTRVEGEFDIILIDTPPMLHMTDARILGGRSDGGILVFRAGATTLEQAQAARDLLDRDGIPLVGAVLNDFAPEREGLSNYYSSYTRYQTEDAASETTLA
ncbi:GumC family protein [Terriglobus sp.]|uniref:GumC family protein n=1 Tax=Terriglobus sp. TaxID=1889013 RepID=UPI003B006106